MATTDRTKLAEPGAEQQQAQAIAARYRCEYVDLREASIDREDDWYWVILPVDEHDRSLDKLPATQLRVLCIFILFEQRPHAHVLGRRVAHLRG